MTPSRAKEVRVEWHRASDRLGESDFAGTSGGVGEKVSSSGIVGVEGRPHEREDKPPVRVGEDADEDEDGPNGSPAECLRRGVTLPKGISFGPPRGPDRLVLDRGDGAGRAGVRGATSAMAGGAGNR